MEKRYEYVRELPIDKRFEIFNAVFDKLHEEGFRGKFLADCVHMALAGKVCDLKDTIDLVKLGL